MNLDGKYIKLDSNNVESVIKLLYDNGHCWLYGVVTDLESTIKMAIRNIKERNYTYLIFVGETFFFQSIIEDNIEFFDINKYLREYKLKRILK